MTNSYLLSAADIARAVRDAEEAMTGEKLQHSALIHFRLVLEEILLNYRSHFGETKAFMLKKSDMLGIVRFALSVQGESFDPFSLGDSEDLVLLRKLHTDGSGISGWTYRNGENVVYFTFKMKKKLSLTAMTFVSMFLAVVVGMFCGFLAPETSALILESFIVPTLNAIMSIISAIAGPMIFFSLVWGICTIGDMETLSRIGRRTVIDFIVETLFFSVFCSVLCVPFFMGKSAGGSMFRLADFYKLLLGFIPESVISPFITGNTQQLIFMALVSGIVLLKLGNRVSSLTTLVEHVTIFTQEVMMMASFLIPVLVFLSFLKVIMNGEIEMASQAYMALPLAVALAMVVMLICTLRIVFIQKVSMMTFLRKIMPSSLLATTTASSAASLPLTIETCERDYGISKKMVEFGVPLGQTLFKIGTLLVFISVGFCVSGIYGIAFTQNQFMVMVVTCFLLALSSPPIPGGPAVCYSILFRQLGIPQEAIGLALAVNVLIDFPLTGVNIFCLQTKLIGIADKLDLIDKDILQKAKT